MPAVLLVATERSRGTLAAARALADAGWRVGVGTPSGRGMAASSRATAATHQVPRPRNGGDQFVAAVNAAAPGYDLVFGGADDWAAALSAWRDRLDVRVGHADTAAVARVLDKSTIALAAADAGLPSPRTVVADDDAMTSWDGPAIVKCRTHWRPGMANRTRIEATRTDDAAGRRRAAAAIREVGLEPVLQEVVHGELGALTGIFADGRLHGRVQQLAGGLWPYPSGVSANAVTVRIDEQLVERVEAMLTALDWEGIVEVQFLHDVDGAARLIDCNPRFYGSLSLASAAGVNLPDLWGRWLLEGTVPEAPDATEGVTYQWFAGDLRRALAERRGGLLRDLAATLARAVGTDVHSVVRRGDVAPALVPLLDRVRRRG